MSESQNREIFSDNKLEILTNEMSKLNEIYKQDETLGKLFRMDQMLRGQHKEATANLGSAEARLHSACERERDCYHPRDAVDRALLDCLGIRLFELATDSQRLQNAENTTWSELAHFQAIAKWLPRDCDRGDYPEYQKLRNAWQIVDTAFENYRETEDAFLGADNSLSGQPKSELTLRRKEYMGIKYMESCFNYKKSFYEVYILELDGTYPESERQVARQYLDTLLQESNQKEEAVSR